jgi:hypothetical protein
VGEKEHAIVGRLDTCLMDRDILQEVISQLDCTLLKVMHTYYFDSAHFESMFFQLAEELYNAHKDSVLTLSQAFQKELYFMLCKASLQFSFEEMQLILDAYIYLLNKCEALHSLMATE